MRPSNQTCISATPGEITQGLFGGVFLFVFEILPYLKKHKAYPIWSISSELYGAQPGFVVIPGLLDLAYDVPERADKTIKLSDIRRDHSFALGNDWHSLHSLWTAYFRVPARVETSVRGLGDLSSTLGVHYRGRDKNTATWDSNPISIEDFVLIIRDALKRRPDLNQAFVATDEPAFITYLASHIDIPMVGFGAGRHHLEETTDSERAWEADRPLTDCLALSRCAVVLNTSSALSAFAKILNPDLEIYRCAASKMFTDIPYFPNAYIPPYRSDDKQVASVIVRTMAGDWLSSAAAQRFRRNFAFRPRAPLRALLRRARGQARKLPAMMGMGAARAG